MAGKLSRRKYAEVVRLLKYVIGNEKAGIARRMRAAQMLIDIYDRHERQQERAEGRRAKQSSHKVKETQETPGEVIPSQETTCVDEESQLKLAVDKQIAEVFGSILNDGSTVDAE